MDVFVWTEVLLGLAELSRAFFWYIHYNEMCVKKKTDVCKRRPTYTR